MVSHASSWPRREGVLLLRCSWTLITSSSRYSLETPCQRQTSVARSPSSLTRVRRTHSTTGWVYEFSSQGSRSRPSGESRYRYRLYSSGLHKEEDEVEPSNIQPGPATLTGSRI